MVCYNVRIKNNKKWAPRFGHMACIATGRFSLRMSEHNQDYPKSSFSFPHRYLWPLKAATRAVEFLFYLAWDSDIPTDDDIGMAFFLRNDSGFSFLFMVDEVRVDSTPFC